MTSLHLTNAFHAHSGGVRTLYLALLTAANRLGRRACLVVPGARDEVQDVGRHGRIYVIAAPTAPFDRRYRVLLPHLYLPGFAGRITRILRDERPDIVEICDKHSLSYLAGLIRKRWLRGVGRPTLIGVSAERFDDNLAAFVSDGRIGRAWARWYMRTVYAQPFDYHVANSDYTAAELRAVLPPHRQRVVRVLPPGVDIAGVANSLVPRHDARLTWQARLRLADADTPLLLYAGRLSPEKNVALLAETLAALGRQFTGQRHHMVVAGDGPMRQPLEQRLARELPGRATFVGHLSDRQELASLYAAADVFVHPNPREPFGIAPLEAMAAGLPIVVPATGGVRAYADDQTAWLATPEPGPFAAAILCALRQRHSPRVQRARARAREFDMPRAMDRLFALYDELHDERQRRP